jgi:hypothetical protein
VNRHCIFEGGTKTLHFSEALKQSLLLVLKKLIEAKQWTPIEIKGSAVEPIGNNEGRK